MFLSSIVYVPAGITWKSLVHKSVLSHENQKFRAECAHHNLFRIANIEKSLDYPSLIWTTAQTDPKRKNNYAFLAKLNTLPETITETECNRCSQSFTDPQLHFFCGCSGFSSHREEFWEQIVNECPVELSAALWNMSDVELTETLLGKQLTNFDFEVNMLLLRITAQCWNV